MPYAWRGAAPTGKIGNALVVATTLGNISVRRWGIGDVDGGSVSKIINLYKTILC